MSQEKLSARADGCAHVRPCWRLVWVRASWLVSLMMGLTLGNEGLRGGASSLQFDVFLGYGSQPTGADGLVREAGWFMVGCEVHNSGPSFNAVFELGSSQFGRGQTRRFEVELPTNTRKRFVIPAFASAGYNSSWDARLLDERGRVRAEMTGLRPRTASWESMVLGGLPRTFGGLPRFPDLPNSGNRGEQQPVGVRMLSELMPDNAVAYEGLDAVYLNSEKALELRAPQGEALVSWVRGGGHLIVAVEDPAEVNSVSWLRSLVPCRMSRTVTLKATEAVAAWGRPLVGAGSARGGTVRQPGQVSTFPKYNAAWLHQAGASDAAGPGVRRGVEGLGEVEFPVATGAVSDGEVLLAVDGTPLVVRGRRGHGQVTLLTFSPEREPFRSWEGRSWFWARLLAFPAEWYEVGGMNMYGGTSVDGVFGLMIDSRQVRKLPVSWLLALLVAYLVVIGPFDRYVLRRLKREMLTWVTFPAYVVLFSVLIYYIGYRLRAGETEWRELHVVDVVPVSIGAELRGRTYASIYSPVNARYRLASNLPHATLRGEYLGMYGGGREGSRIEMMQRGDGFEADVFVGVWTSEMCVSDWLQADDPPVSASLEKGEAAVRVRVRNHLGVGFAEMRVIHEGTVYTLGELAAGAEGSFVLEEMAASPLRTYVTGQAQSFGHLVQQRQQAFGADSSVWPEAGGGPLTAVSFLGSISDAGAGNQRQYVYPSGMDLSPLVGRGDTVLLVWVPDYAPVPTMRQFKAVRIGQGTMLRLVLPAASGRRM